MSDYIEIDGNFMCQDPNCRESCDTAKYFMGDLVLAWMCQNGHRSIIKEFKL